MGVLKTLPVIIVGLALLPACNQDNSNSGAAGGTSETAAQSSGRGAGGTTNDAGSYAPDNTGRNQRDRTSSMSLTPEDQGGSASDLEITRQVRQALHSDSQLSAAAANVKVITQNGKVTLRGPVNNPEEQQTIGSLAKGVPGVTAVDNQLEVKSNQ